MTTGSTDILSPPPFSEVIPRLEQGDRLTRAEFERRYAAMPELKKAELIEGRVYMPSPVTSRHGRPHARLIRWLGAYEDATPGVALNDNTTIRFDNDNEPQPDALLAIEAACGGQSRLDEDDYIIGPPELVAEVTQSTASYDLHDKLHVYRRQGICEYVVWRVLDEQVDWFCLVGGNYEPLLPDNSGLFKSKVFPGLWLDPLALVKWDFARVFLVVQQGTASREHAEFVALLESRRKS